MELKGNKILITGADGFIGSHLTEYLVEQGHSVRAFVYYNAFNSWGWLDHSEPGIKEKLEVFPGDIRDPQRVRQAVKGCDLVFHLAALIAIPYSYHSPASYIDTNVKGTLNILEAARELGTSKVIHTSTSEVYGTARSVPISEEHPLQPQSPYSASKTGADQLAMSFYYSFDTPVAIIRPFNTFGPRQSARAVIPTVITQIAWGNKRIKLGALKPTRDFNYIEDMVQGFIAVAESDATPGEVINFGTGQETPIGELAGMISGLMGASVELIPEDKRIRPEKSEVERLCADNSKALKLTAWTPSYTGLEGLQKGLRKTIDWFIKPENLKLYKTDIYNI